MSFQSINPYTGQVLASYEPTSPEDLHKAVGQAEWAFAHWRRTSAAYRIECLARLAQLLRERREACALLITEEMGKVLVEAQGEIDKCAWACDYYAEHAEAMLRHKPAPADGRKSYVRFDPTGCVLGIMPWNFPFWQVFRYAVPTLMAGNVTLLKHAPNVFGCAHAIAQLFHDAGFPKGVFQQVVAGTDVVPYLLQQPIVQGVTLTGSEAAGRAVASLAGQHLRKSVLELGGSDPFIVLKDADVRRAAHIGALSRLMNAGQSCIAAKRFIVEAPVADDFLQALVSEVQRCAVGDPKHPDTRIGPLARLDLAEKLQRQTRESIVYGAHVALEGGQDGTLFAPYVLTQVKPGMPAFDEELFGPVLSVLVAQDEQEAVELANQTRFGLGASIWTADLDKAEMLARDVQAGGVFVNALVKSDPRLPFGGVKDSGYGRELAAFGIREFANAKTVYIG
jgi:succinate-semialdehyde dehydrogenase/glutarate-semialdehyde dehydrogenase